MTEQYIAYQLERALPESVGVLFDSKIVFLCANQPKQTSDALFKEINTLLEKHSITAGCSNPFTDFLDLKYCYREAEFALQFAENKQGGQALYHFKHHTLEHFLQYGCSILPVRLQRPLYEEGLRQLRADAKARSFGGDYDGSQLRRLHA